MKTIKFFSALFLAMSLFMSCSTSEIMDSNEGTGTTPNVDPSQLNFKFADLDLTTEVGKANDSETASRGANDVDDLGRPKGEYPLSDIFIVREEQSSTSETANIDSKKMNVIGNSKIAYAFANSDGSANETNPTHVYITPAATKDNPNTGVLVKLSILKKEISNEMNLSDIEQGDLFYYKSTDQRVYSLTKIYENFAKELGDILFRSAPYYLVFDNKEKTLVAFKLDKHYQMIFPANEPGTEAGGLWPIYVNRTGAGLSIRYMVTGDYYDNNIGDEAAIATAFEQVTGFPMNTIYSDQSFIGNFPSAFDVENEKVMSPTDPKNRCDLLIYDTDKAVTEMTKIQFKYAEASKEIVGMGLATTETPFVYPMTFGIANSFNIIVGVKHNNMNVKMNFKIASVNSQYALTTNTNTIFYLKMSATQLRDFYQQAITKTRSNGITTFELPSSAIEVATSAVSAK